MAKSPEQKEPSNEQSQGGEIILDTSPLAPPDVPPREPSDLDIENAGGPPDPKVLTEKKRQGFEKKWLSSRKLDPILRLLKYIGDRRKLQLFGLYCLLKIADTYHNAISSNNYKAIKTVESFINGEIEIKALMKVINDHKTTLSVLKDFNYIEGNSYNFANRCSDDANYFVRYSDNAKNFTLITANGDKARMRQSEEEVYRVNLLREMFGNPFAKEKPKIKEEWVNLNNKAVYTIVQSICTNERFEEMPYLADALEDAGCSDGRILDHLRGLGPHVRGCWALDLILGKEKPNRR